MRKSITHETIIEVLQKNKEVSFDTLRNLLREKTKKETHPNTINKELEKLQNNGNIVVIKYEVETHHKTKFVAEKIIKYKNKNNLHNVR